MATDHERALNRERQRRYRERQRKLKGAPTPGVVEADAEANRKRKGAVARLAEARALYEAHVKAHPVKDVLAWASMVRTPFIRAWKVPRYMEAPMLLAAHGGTELRTIACRKGSQLGWTRGR